MIEDFHFLRPWWLLALLAPFAIAWLASRFTDIRRQWSGIIAPHLLDGLVVEGDGKSRIRPWWLLVGVLAIATIAAAGPTWQREAPPFVEDTAPLVIAIDLSLTMDAIDITPSRLERAKLKVKDIVALRGGARTAVVTYAGSAHIVLPLTEDASLIATYVDALATRIMPVKGKDTGKALQLAEDLLGREDSTGTILFVTDGIEQKAFEAFKRKSKDGFVVLGIGTADGGPVKTADGGFLTDSGGARVFSKLDVEALKNLHALTGADVATLTTDDTDVRWVAQRIRTNFAEKTATDGDRWRDLGWWLVVPITLLFAVSFRKGWVVRLAVLVIIANGAIGPGNAQATELVDMWLTGDQQGRRAFEQGEFEKAASHFEDPMWKGVAYYRAGKFADALDVLCRCRYRRELVRPGKYSVASDEIR
ncbi:VWA domain-containing protein [Rhizobium sp. RCAM05350]|nr:VWA domain-containing protein [Rhizobium sp. RCAM05350]